MSQEHKQESGSSATLGSGRTNCSPEILQAIYGKQEEKNQQYDTSLERWWKEYAARKNDEEEEHVADSMMYDERCTLPRTVTRPEFISDKSNKS